MSQSLTELLAQRAQIEAQILAVQRETRTAAIAKIREMMTENGLSIADISGGTKAKAATGTTNKVAAKYRNAESGETWSGRGLKPKWLSNALAAGKQLSDFAIG